MMYFIQVDKDSKRVTGYSSTKSNLNTVLEIEIDSNNKEFEELLFNPFIFKFENNTFVKDVEYQNKIIEEKKNRLTNNKIILKLTEELAKNKIELIQKNQIINMLIKEQAKSKIKKMKEGI